MARAYSPSEILKKKFKTLNWSKKWVDAFGNPETTGTWFIGGNSTNGKTVFVLELAKELGSIQKKKVFMNSMEEGTRKTMQDSLIKLGINSKKLNILIGNETLEELDERLTKRNAPAIVIVDSIQFLNVRTPRLVRFIEKHSSTKLLIFISQARGKEPKGNVAIDIRYRADLKVWVEGFKALSQGRYNAGGIYTIWEEGANKYWGQKQLQEQK